MQVRSAMTADPVTTGEDVSLDEAIDLMDRHGICHLPILRDGDLVGVVSDRDLLEATGWLPSRVRPLVRGGEGPSRVGQVMRSNAAVARPAEDVLEAASEMLVQNVGCLPVMDDDILVGILAMSDVLRVFVQACRDGRLGPEHDPSAADCMTDRVVTVHPDTTLGEARRLCLEENIRHLPVLHGRELVGILSDRDLRAAIGRGRRDDYSIDELMTTPVVTVHPTTPLSRCGERLIEKGIGTLPVLDGDRLVGLLSGYDIVRFALQALREAGLEG